MTIDTDDIMNIGLKLVGWKKMPPDSAIHVKGRKINRVLIAVDVTSAELILAKNLGCDAVIAHHPLGSAAVNFYKVLDRHTEFMVENGVPQDKAEDMVKNLKNRIEIKNHAHIYNDVRKMYEENLKGNLIVLGHLAGDSIGLNALADRLENKGVETIRLGIIPPN